MRHRTLALETLVLFALAAVSCSENAALQAAPDAGRDAGFDAGHDSGRARDPNEGELCDAGERFAEDKKICGEAHMDWLHQCKPRYSSVQCYIATPGEACLSPEEPTVVGRGQDAIMPYGYRGPLML